MLKKYEVDGIRVSFKEARKAFIYVYKARKSFTSTEEVNKAFDYYIRTNRSKENETKND